MAIMLGGLVVLVAALFAIGKFYPGSGAKQLDWRPTRSPELEAQNDIDDFSQMLDAMNAYRRRHGKPELTEDDVRRQVGEPTDEEH